MRELAVASLDVIVEPVREKVEDLQQILLLVLIDGIEVNLGDFFHKPQVQCARTVFCAVRPRTQSPSSSHP